MTNETIQKRLAQQMLESWKRMDDIQKLAATVAYSIGYHDGFDVGTAAERSIEAMQERFNEIDRETGDCLAPSPLMVQLYEIVKPQQP